MSRNSLVHPFGPLIPKGFFRLISLLMIFLAMVLSTAGQSNFTPKDSLLEKLKNPEQDTNRVKTLNQLSFAILRDEPDSALKLSQEALALSQELTFPYGISSSYQSIGRAHLMMGSFDQGLQNMLIALKQYEAQGRQSGVASVTANIGTLYQGWRKEERALEYYQKALDMLAEIGDKKRMFPPRNNMANILMSQGKDEEALKLFQENLSNLDPEKDLNWLTITRFNIGQLLETQNKLQEAYDTYKLAQTGAQKLDRKYLLASIHNRMGTTLSKMGQNGKALEELDKGRFYASLIEDRIILSENLRYTAELYEKTGAYQKALRAYKQMNTLEDSVFNQQQSNKLEELRVQYETEKKQDQIRLLEQEKENQDAKLQLLALENSAKDAKAQRTNWILAFLILALLGVSGFIIVLVRTNNERKRANEALVHKNQEIQQQKEELEDLNREKDGLMGVVAHDIRAPLNRASSMADLIKLSGPLNQEQEQYLNMIRKNNEDGTRLIQELLDLFSIEHGKSTLRLTNVDLKQFLQHSVSGFTPAANKKAIQLNFQHGEEELELQTDENYLNRILDNLISNALKFTHPNKNVWISANRQNGHVLISVRDQGQGISKEDQKKMFKKFQRLSAKPTAGESSTGLGLSIIKALVERLEGKIDVESEVGVGTEFTIRFPVKDN